MFAKGLKNIITNETSISDIDCIKGQMIYRGYDITYLVEQYSFEEVAYLLWFRKFPNHSELSDFTKQLRTERLLPTYIYNLIRELPSNMHVMNQLETIISSLSTPSSTHTPYKESIRLVAAFPVIIAALYRKHMNMPIINPDFTLSHIENFLYMLTGSVPHHMHVQTLEKYLILTMEHGLNASTFTARVIASTNSDMVSAVVGGIRALKGPLHGGALSEVLYMLYELEGLPNKDVTAYLLQKIQSKQKIMGFGHRMYQTKDPRSEQLKKLLLETKNKDPFTQLAFFIETEGTRLLHAHKYALYPNVDFYAAVVLKQIGLNPLLFTPTFSMSRIIGWIAHIIEQREEHTIFRPKSKYIGDYYC
ncbi:citrate/2-methylcitrate synthase [Bacillus thuringiensis]